MSVQLFTDGGSRGNPGPAAAAFVLQGDDGVVLDARGEAIGIQTNNVAETGRTTTPPTDTPTSAPR